MPDLQSVLTSEKERSGVLAAIRNKISDKDWAKMERMIERREKKRERGKRVRPITPKYKAMNIQIENRGDKFEKICKRKGWEYSKYHEEFVVRDEEGLIFVFVVEQFKRPSVEAKERLEFLGKSGIRNMIYRGEEI